MTRPRQRSSTSNGDQDGNTITTSNCSTSHHSKSFRDIPLLDYFQADIRPTFVIDLDVEGHSSKYPELVFSNNALNSSGLLHERVVFSLSLAISELSSEAEYGRFRDWLQDSISRSQPRNLEFAPIYFGYSWHTTTIANRWLVVCATSTSVVTSSSVNDNSKAQIAAYTAPTLNDQDIQDLTHLRNETALLGLDDSVSRNVRLLATLGPSSQVDFILNFDFSKTSLGPISTWSRELVQACQLMLVDPDPCTVFWGEDLSMMWNEPYNVVAGDKHPRTFGSSAWATWGEVFQAYGPLFDQMRIDRKAFKQENQRLIIFRKGYFEETFFNLTVMPVSGPDGSVVGFYEPVIETTKEILSERRMQILLKVNESMSAATSLEDLWSALLSALTGHEHDIYFAVLCSIVPGENERFVLEGSVGLNSAQLRTQLSGEHSSKVGNGLLSAFQTARRINHSVILHKRDNTLSQFLTEALKTCGMEEECRSIVVSPLSAGTDDSTTAFIAIGTNPRREHDDDYAIFTQLLVRQIESTITFIKLVEKEKALLVEQAAYESEVKFKRFAEQAQVGIYIFDKSGAIKFCNDTWLELCGLSRDDIHKPMCWVNTVHPENRDGIVGYWQKLIDGEGPQSFEVQYTKPWRATNSGGEDFYLDRTYVLANAEAEVNEFGECTGIVGCVTDISHVKWAEKIQSQRLTEALELKRQQENFLDITSHEMRNPLNAILHCASELIEQIGDQINSVMSSEKRAIVLGECLDAASTIAYCGKHQKRIIDDVLTMSKLDSGLLSISPLTAYPPDIVKQVLRVFETELRTTQIEAVSQISETYRQHGVNAVLLDPYRVIQILINLFSNAIKFMKDEEVRNLKIILDVSLEEPADQDGGIRYVPSGRHRKDPTHHAEWGSGEVLFIKFSVQDTGPGMTPEEANSLFNRFIQGSPRTHAQYGGSGLGLFISRELAELHGGRIGLSSQVGLGSTFDFYIKGRRDLHAPPRSQRGERSRPSSTVFNEERRATTAHQHEAVISALVSPAPIMKSTKSSPSVLQTAHRRHLRILVVEDNLINQRILKKLMTQQGYEVSIANHGEEALAIIETSRWHRDHRETGPQIDLVLCDVEMPVMDGKATVRRIRQLQSQRILHSNIPVIAVTGNARSEQIKVAIQCGFDDVVSKPYEVQDLLKSIKHFTEKDSAGG